MDTNAEKLLFKDEVFQIVAQSAANGTPLNSFRLLSLKSFRLFSIAMLRKFLTFAARWQKGVGLMRLQVKTLRHRLSGGAPICALKNESA